MQKEKQQSLDIEAESKKIDTPKNKVTLPTPKKFKKKAMDGATSLLSIPKAKYIGKMRFSGLTLELTENHAILSRAMCISIFPSDNPTYTILNYIYELSQNKERTENQEKELTNGKSFMLSLCIADFGGADVQHTITLFLLHSKVLELYAKQKLESETNGSEDSQESNLDVLMNLYNQLTEELAEKEKVAEIE